VNKSRARGRKKAAVNPKQAREDELSEAVDDRIARAEEFDPKKHDELLLDDAEQPIWWRKKGGGSFRMKRWDEGAGKFRMIIIKPKQRFLAKPSEIPVSFRDLVVPESDLPPSQPLPAVDARAQYELEESPEKKGMYNVVNVASRKALNANPLTAERAAALLEDLG
jgi:hypothetical protein